MLEDIKDRIAVIKVMATNKFFIVGTVFWLLGLLWAISLGFEAIVAVILMGVGNFCYDLAKGKYEDDNDA